VPRTILYDNTKLAVARILGDGTRTKTRAFSELQSHYLFAEKFGRPAKGNDKGKVEGLVGYARRNFMCRFRATPHGRSSTNICSRNAKSDASADYGDTSRPSASVSSATRAVAAFAGGTVRSLR